MKDHLAKYRRKSGLDDKYRKQASHNSRVPANYDFHHPQFPGGVRRIPRGTPENEALEMDAAISEEATRDRARYERNNKEASEMPSRQRNLELLKPNYKPGERGRPKSFFAEIRKNLNGQRFYM